MVAVPTAFPVTTPEIEFTEATLIFEELQVPPVTELLNAVVELIHTEVVPEIVPALGSAVMVRTATSELVPHALVA